MLKNVYMKCNGIALEINKWRMKKHVLNDGQQWSFEKWVLLNDIEAPPLQVVKCQRECKTKYAKIGNNEQHSVKCIHC